MRRAYKFRLYPTAGQATRAAQCLRDHQRMYNAALEERREAWQRRKVSIRYGQQSAQLKDIRAVDPDQSRWSFSSQQATLRRPSVRLFVCHTAVPLAKLRTPTTSQRPASPRTQYPRSSRVADDVGRALAERANMRIRTISRNGRRPRAGVWGRVARSRR